MTVSASRLRLIGAVMVAAAVVPLAALLAFPQTFIPMAFRNGWLSGLIYGPYALIGLAVVGLVLIAASMVLRRPA